MSLIKSLGYLTVATGEVRTLGTGGDPAWSPDGATIYFLRARNEDITVTPVVTPKETGVSATLRF